MNQMGSADIKCDNCGPECVKTVLEFSARQVTACLYSPEELELERQQKMWEVKRQLGCTLTISALRLKLDTADGEVVSAYEEAFEAHPPVNEDK